MNRSAKLFEQQTSDAALSALDVIAEALSISPYSEQLLEMKAESMFMVCAVLIREIFPFFFLLFFFCSLFKLANQFEDLDLINRCVSFVCF